MKLYEIFTHTAYEFDHDFNTKIFLDETKAREYYNEVVKSFRKEAEDEELEIDESDNEFDAYMDGSANEYELCVKFTEVEPIE